MKDRRGSGATLRLGNLELAVMHHVWSGGPADVKTVHRALGVERGITLHTVQSTMERLYRKGLLNRGKVSHAYVYAPRLSQEEYGSRVVEDALARVMRGSTEPMLSAFVDVAARTGAKTLDRLQRLIDERRGADRLRRAKP